MSREIKFRCWDRTEKAYIGYPLFRIGVLNSSDGLELEENEDLVVEQYTGLKDKNGVEIYEGDVVVVTRKLTDRSRVTHTYEINYDNSRAAFVLWNEHMCGMFFSGDASCSEVVGNIHENSELLEGKK